MTTTAPLLRVRDLTVRYGAVTAVDRACLDAGRSAITAIVGPSGCGKTSLLRAVAGFERPIEGTVTIGERIVAGDGNWAPPERRSVGMVFQQGALFPHLSVIDNVRFGVESRPNANEHAETALDAVGLADLGRRFPDELSGGQQQRVALARALAPAPEIVLLDEPFANLDAALRVRLRDEVGAILRRSGTTAIVVTHDQEEALSLADRVAVMMAGAVLQVDSPEEIYNRPNSPAVAEFIGEGQLFECDVSAGRCDSPFGAADCDAPDGGGTLLVRPEDLRMLADYADRGALGHVTERHFYGHDLLHCVRLANATTVRVRDLCSNGFRPGDSVRVVLREKKYRVFPSKISTAR